MAALLAVFHALPRVCGFVCGVAALHRLLPAWHTTGYACAADGAPLRYRLNGLLVLIVTVAGWAALQPHHASDAAAHWWAYWAAAHVVGLGASAAVFAMTWSDRELPLRSLTSDQKQLCERAARGENVQSLLPPAPHRSLAAHFFFGFKVAAIQFNPRLGQVDLKMLCYTIGACGLLWNLLSGAALRLSMHGSLSLAFWTYSACLVWFIVDYMLFEFVHLYTYDTFAEKLGFKIVWGCFAWYPFYYCSGMWPVITARPEVDIRMGICYIIAIMYLFGWVLTRGANLQKYIHKITSGLDHQHSALGHYIIPMRVVPGTPLLCGAFWGVARHVNYLGEIIQAVALALPGSLVAQSWPEAFLPWAYPIYYVAILIPRQHDDDDLLRSKYGDAIFRLYSEAVPYRIVPGVW